MCMLRFDALETCTWSSQKLKEQLLLLYTTSSHMAKEKKKSKSRKVGVAIRHQDGIVLMIHIVHDDSGTLTCLISPEPRPARRAATIGPSSARRQDYLADYRYTASIIPTVEI